MVIANGCATSEPTSWTASPVVPVMSTARMEPPSARHVPTFTRTGLVDPEVPFTKAVPPNAGEPDTVARSSDPVLMIASSTEDVSGGTEVGEVTPGNPVTPAHVPIGSVTALPRDDAAEGVEAELEVLPDDAAPLAPAPCGDVASTEPAVCEGGPPGAGAGEETDVVVEVGVDEVEVGVPAIEAASDELGAPERPGPRKR